MRTGRFTELPQELRNRAWTAPPLEKVEIHERTPVAFARVGPRIFLIDAGGTLMELPQKHKYSFPVILGMNPGEPLSTRLPRMKAYNQLVQALDVVLLAEKRDVLRRGTRSKDFWLLAGSFFVCGATTNGLVGTHLVPGLTRSSDAGRVTARTRARPPPRVRARLLPVAPRAAPTPGDRPRPLRTAAPAPGVRRG